MVQNAVLPRGNEENAEENDMDTNEDLEICDEQGNAKVLIHYDSCHLKIDFNIGKILKTDRSSVISSFPPHKPCSSVYKTSI